MSIAGKTRHVVKKALQRRGYELHRDTELPGSFFPLLVSRAIMAKKKPEDFFLVQVGANDGVSNDPVRRFILGNAISCLLIEPLPDIFEKLRKNYQCTDGRVRLSNVAISNTRSSLPLYRIKEAYAEEYKKIYKHTANPSGITSFDRNNVASFLRARNTTFFTEAVLDEWIECVSVDGVPLNELLEKQMISHIDMLQIDTEGFDYEVVKMAMDLDMELPDIINYEHKKLTDENRKACERLLHTKGYSTVKHDGDTCAFKRIAL